MPFELEDLYFPGFKKETTTFIMDLEKKEEKMNLESILLSEYSIYFNLLFIYLSFTLQYFMVLPSLKLRLTLPNLKTRYLNRGINVKN